MGKEKIKIILPDNHKIYSATIKNNCLTIKYSLKEKFIPHDGDILFANVLGENWIFIYNERNKKKIIYDYCFFCISSQRLEWGDNIDGKGFCNKKSIKELRLATEKERNLLYQALSENNIEWNVKEKKFEHIQEDGKIK